MPERIQREAGPGLARPSVFSVLCSSVLPDGFEMEATGRIEDAVSMATELSIANSFRA